MPSEEAIYCRRNDESSKLLLLISSIFLQSSALHFVLRVGAPGSLVVEAHTASAPNRDLPSSVVSHADTRNATEKRTSPQDATMSKLFIG